MTDENTCLNCGWAEWYRYKVMMGICSFPFPFSAAQLRDLDWLDAPPTAVVYGEHPHKDCNTWKPKTGEKDD